MEGVSGEDDGTAIDLRRWASSRPWVASDPAGLGRRDRRVAPRYPSVTGRAWIGWRDGRDFLRAAAWLLDISQGGSLIAADEPPPTLAVWVRLDGPLLPDWFEARVLEVRRGDVGPCAVRVIFPGACPYELFMAVAYGRACRISPPSPRQSIDPSGKRGGLGGWSS